ncbi:lytic transglycosylase domain-containing protein [Ornithinimicrobium cerasi]|uniref:LysM repeat-containing protein n=1 Tax=Ornithinimicrobium cerasi TaxID=2248773 RepID=A0A285VGH8_9MICO|nr:lytic transglycosylase domain-containing protein [Ornithinimicrobium cerasi]SOC51641.1 LysM repeat-containing protein [Ornithinimicrobium cerasi]
MSPIFAALPPADLPTMAYHPAALHAAQLLGARGDSTHTVRSGDTVYDIAAQHGVSPRSLITANNLKDSGRWIIPGQVLRIPPATSGQPSTTPTAVRPPSATASRPAPPAPAAGAVTVRAGDTLSGIALRHGTTVRAIASANGIKDARLIYPGQRLVIPGAGSSSGSPAPSAPSAAPRATAPTPTAGGTYTVRAGDTLSGIAARHGTTVAAIARASGVSSGSYIYPGQKLRLPGGTAPAAPSASAPRTTPYDEHNIGDHKAGEKVPDTFLHYRYSDGVARSAAANREYLAAATVPGRDEIKKLIVSTSKRHGVDPTLMLALSYQESGWNQRAVSPANAIGAMQVIPDSGRWASGLVGRELNLLDPEDNVEAGVAIMKALLRSTDKFDHAVGGYYQGLASVRQHGLFNDTRSYVANIKHHMRSM